MPLLLYDVAVGVVDVEVALGVAIAVRVGVVAVIAVGVADLVVAALVVFCVAAVAVFGVAVVVALLLVVVIGFLVCVLLNTGSLSPLAQDVDNAAAFSAVVDVFVVFHMSFHLLVDLRAIYLPPLIFFF